MSWGKPFIKTLPWSQAAPITGGGANRRVITKKRQSSRPRDHEVSALRKSDYLVSVDNKDYTYGNSVNGENRDNGDEDEAENEMESWVEVNRLAYGLLRKWRQRLLFRCTQKTLHLYASMSYTHRLKRVSVLRWKTVVHRKIKDSPALSLLICLSRSISRSFARWHNRINQSKKKKIKSQIISTRKTQNLMRHYITYMRWRTLQVKKKMQDSLRKGTQYHRNRRLLCSIKKWKTFILKMRLFRTIPDGLVENRMRKRVYDIRCHYRSHHQSESRTNSVENGDEILNVSSSINDIDELKKKYTLNPFCKLLFIRWLRFTYQHKHQHLQVRNFTQQRNLRSCGRSLIMWNIAASECKLLRTKCDFLRKTTRWNTQCLHFRLWMTRAAEVKESRHRLFLQREERLNIMYANAERLQKYRENVLAFNVLKIWHRKAMKRMGVRLLTKGMRKYFGLIMLREAFSVWIDIHALDIIAVCLQRHWRGYYIRNIREADRCNQLTWYRLQRPFVKYFRNLWQRRWIIDVLKENVRRIKLDRHRLWIVKKVKRAFGRLLKRKKMLHTASVKYKKADRHYKCYLSSQRHLFFKILRRILFRARVNNKRNLSKRLEILSQSLHRWRLREVQVPKATNRLLHSYCTLSFCKPALKKWQLKLIDEQTQQDRIKQASNWRKKTIPLKFFAKISHKITLAKEKQEVLLRTRYHRYIFNIQRYFYRLLDYARYKRKLHTLSISTHYQSNTDTKSSKFLGRYLAWEAVTLTSSLTSLKQQIWPTGLRLRSSHVRTRNNIPKAVVRKWFRHFLRFAVKKASIKKRRLAVIKSYNMNLVTQPFMRLQEIKRNRQKTRTIMHLIMMKLRQMRLKRAMTRFKDVAYFASLTKKHFLCVRRLRMKLRYFFSYPYEKKFRDATYTHKASVALFRMKRWRLLIALNKLHIATTRRGTRRLIALEAVRHHNDKRRLAALALWNYESLHRPLPFKKKIKWRFYLRPALKHWFQAMSLRMVERSKVHHFQQHKQRQFMQLIVRSWSLFTQLQIRYRVQTSVVMYRQVKSMKRQVLLSWTHALEGAYFKRKTDIIQRASTRCLKLRIMRQWTMQVTQNFISRQQIKTKYYALWIEYTKWEKKSRQSLYLADDVAVRKPQFKSLYALGRWAWRRIYRRHFIRDSHREILKGRLKRLIRIWGQRATARCRASGKQFRCLVENFGYQQYVHLKKPSNMGVVGDSLQKLIRQREFFQYLRGHCQRVRKKKRHDFLSLHFRAWCEGVMRQKLQIAAGQHRLQEWQRHVILGKFMVLLKEGIRISTICDKLLSRISNKHILKRGLRRFATTFSVFKKRRKNLLSWEEHQDSLATKMYFRRWRVSVGPRRRIFENMMQKCAWDIWTKAINARKHDYLRLLRPVVSRWKIYVNHLRYRRDLVFKTRALQMIVASRLRKARFLKLRNSFDKLKQQMVWSRQKEEESVKRLVLLASMKRSNTLTLSNNLPNRSVTSMSNMQAEGVKSSTLTSSLPMSPTTSSTSLSSLQAWRQSLQEVKRSREQKTLHQINRDALIKLGMEQRSTGKKVEGIEGSRLV